MSTTPSSQQVIEALETAAEENQLSPLRHGQVVTLPNEGEVWMTGDMHDHRRNFAKFLAAADLPNHPQRHVILHELLHGDHIDPSGAEDSWRILHEAAELKCDFSGQVHFLLANHDLAQIYGEGIMKAGLSVCEAFNAGVKRDFGESADQVTVAITEFLLSLPLAARTANGLFFCHSLPSTEQIAKYDYTVFDRPLEGADYKRKTGAAYQLIWGRNMTPAAVADFAAHVGASLIVTGHQPQDSGYLVNGPQHLIIASDHNQGVYLPLSLTQTYDMDSMVEQIQRFSGME